VAVVNGEAVTAAEVGERLASESVRWGGPPAAMGSRESVKEEVLRELIQEKLMLQRARTLSLTVAGEELDRETAALHNTGGPGESLPAAWRESLRRQLLIRKLVQRELYDTATVSPGEAEAYYRAHLDSYRREDRVRALQIVLRDSRRIPAVRNRLKKGEDFGKVAREESVGPEAVHGGDLGFFTRGTLPDAIDRVVFSLPVGAVSPPVRTPYGYHILKVMERQRGGRPDFASVHGQVIRDLKKEKAEAAWGPWMEALEKSASIEIRKEALRDIRVAGAGPGSPKSGPASLRKPLTEGRKP
jgi:parvulin-like peptidyl-prolyl isomerase